MTRILVLGGGFAGLEAMRVREPASRCALCTRHVAPPREHHAA